MKVWQICSLIWLGLNISCTQDPGKSSPAKSGFVKNDTVSSSGTGRPVVPVSEIITDFNSFWGYYTRNVKLYEDFIALDTNTAPMTKGEFLKRMNSGRYFPLVVQSKDPAPHYRLEKIPPHTDKFVSAYMRQFSADELKFYKMEGKKIPKFSFADINGKLYTSENTKGKIVVFKCWFIGCQACVKEMPALNELVKKYKDHSDILFISLATDGQKDLKQFLAKTRFDYATVADQGKYMSEKLQVLSYPTHFLINKEGVLVRVLPDDIQIAKGLAKEVGE